MRTRAQPIPDRESATPTSGREHAKNFGVGNRAECCPAAADDESAAIHLFKLSRDVILSLDRNGNILCINQRGVQLSGYSELELRGASIFELLLLPEEQQAARQLLADLVEGRAREYQLRWRTKDGAIVHLDGVSVPRLSDSGEFLSTLCTLRDVTERKSAEEKLRKSEEKYRDLIEISPDAIYVVDANGICVLGNRAGAELLGIPQDQLVGTPVTDTYLSEERHLFRERLEKLKTGRTIRFERKFVRKNGKMVPVEVSVSGIRGGYFQAILRDISQRKQAEALLAAEKRILEMIATGVPLKQILNALCVIIEEQRPETLASVLLLNADGVHLDVAAGPKLPKEWTRQMELMPIGPCAGSCGTAAYRGSPVIVSDIATDPLWDVPEHRASALKHGLRASWSNPVLSWKGQVVGTFCMYYREPRSPTSHDVELIELATHLTRVGIERDRAEQALRTSEQLARSHVEVMMRSLDVLATETAPEKFIGEMLRTIGQHLDAHRVLLWLRNQQDDSLRLQLIIENDQPVALDREHPFLKHAHVWRKNAFIQEMLFTKSPAVCDDVEHDSRLGPEFRKYLTSKGTKRFMAVPMFVSGEVRGFIGIQHIEQGAYHADQIELAQALAHHVMLATHGQELVEQQREAAILKERARMARDIHDTLAQGFTGVVVQMEAAEEALMEEDPENAVRHVRRARELARESLGEARRSVRALRPQALEKAGFADALKAIIKNTTAGTSLRAEFQLRGEPRELGPDVEENLLHIGQEALTNALKHARATKFRAQLSFGSEAVRLELSDNGDGFAIDGMNGGGFGLVGMKERAEQIGATVKVSTKPGAGTRIVAVSPYQQP
jgi:PAS domain S-box-containing protein